MSGQLNPVMLEDAHFMYKPNFEGREDTYNDAGKRNFTIRLEDEVAEDLIRQGWTVKRQKPRENGEEGSYYIAVTVKFRDRRGQLVKPPRIVLISSKGRTALTEVTAGLVDLIDIEKIDVIFRPFHWGPIKGESGVAAYLQTIFVIVREDELELKYAAIEDANEQYAIAAGPYGGEILEGEIVDDNEQLAIGR